MAQEEGGRWAFGAGRSWSLLVALALVLASSACCKPDCDDGGGSGGGGGGALIGGGWGNFQGMATTNYYGMFHGFRGTAVGEIESRVGAAGSVTQFSAAIATAPPAGSWNFTLFKNGAAEAATCSIGGGSTSCTDAAHCIAFAAGDRIAVEVVPTGATANAGGPRWTAVFTAGGGCP